MSGRKPIAPEDIHGSATGYSTHGCRCADCCHWKTLQNRQRYGKPYSEKAKSLQCPSCPNYFSSDSDYKAHYKQAHAGRR